MDEKADHFHQAAVHLVKSLKCCKTCYDVTQMDYAEIDQLQFRKDMLAKQLDKLGPIGQDREQLALEIEDLTYLIAKIRQQNQSAYEIGMRQIDQMTYERQLFEKNHQQNLDMQLIAEKDRQRIMCNGVNQLMERIRYLHRINEELVNKFCTC